MLIQLAPMGRMFEKRKARMFKRYSKMSKAFTKIGKEIAVAVKLGGPDPEHNSRLRIAIQNGKSVNMPKDNIQNAIKRASEKDASSMEEVFYEAYGPGGVALYIETATDNTTRTVGNVRSFVNHRGGKLATSGALDFIFQRKGVFNIAKPEIDLEELELELIDHGLEEMFESDEGVFIYSDFTSFGSIQAYLESKNIEVKQAAQERVPQSFAEVSDEQREENYKLIDKLEDDDDVQQVYHNMKEDSTEGAEEDRDTE